MKVPSFGNAAMSLGLGLRERFPVRRSLHYGVAFFGGSASSRRAAMFRVTAPGGLGTALAWFAN